MWQPSRGVAAGELPPDAQNGRLALVASRPFASLPQTNPDAVRAEEPRRIRESYCVVPVAVGVGSGVTISATHADPFQS